MEYVALKTIAVSQGFTDNYVELDEQSMGKVGNSVTGCWFLSPCQQLLNISMVNQLLDDGPDAIN